MHRVIIDAVSANERGCNLTTETTVVRALPPVF
jgi:hypothetical protein